MQQGAFGEKEYVPDIQRHLQNQLSWLEVIITIIIFIIVSIISVINILIKNFKTQITRPIQFMQNRHVTILLMIYSIQNQLLPSRAGNAVHQCKALHEAS